MKVLIVLLALVYCTLCQNQLITLNYIDSFCTQAITEIHISPSSCTPGLVSGCSAGATFQCVSAITAGSFPWQSGYSAFIQFGINQDCNDAPVELTYILTTACTSANTRYICENAALYSYSYSSPSCGGTGSPTFVDTYNGICIPQGSNPRSGTTQTCQLNDILAAYGAAPVTCVVGDAQCISDSAFDTCIYLDAYLNTGYAATQSCAAGTTCHQNGNGIQCY